MGPEFLPRGRSGGKDEVNLISLPGKEKSEWPFILVELGYCPAPWTAMYTIIMHIAALGIVQNLTYTLVHGASG